MQEVQVVQEVLVAQEVQVVLKVLVAQEVQEVQEVLVVLVVLVAQEVLEVLEVPREQRSVRTWLGHVCVAVAVAWVWRSSWVVWREVEPVDVALSYGGLVVVAQGQMA